MSRILDGPAGPIDLVNARAPIFLRVVVDDGGKVDCLDQLEDSPAMSERIHVYEKVPGTDHGVALINLGGRKGCVRMATGDYRHRPDVDGEAVRETGSWREWCQAQAGHGGCFSGNRAAPLPRRRGVRAHRPGGPDDPPRDRSGRPQGDQAEGVKRLGDHAGGLGPVARLRTWRGVVECPGPAASSGERRTGW